MKVRELKALLEQSNDDDQVVVPGFDHSYIPATVEMTTALQEGDREWCEDYGEGITPESEYGPRVGVVVFRAGR